MGLLRGLNPYYTFWHSCWIKGINLTINAMKKNLKTPTLILGIIVAIIAFSNSNSFAEKPERMTPLMSLPQMEIKSAPIEINLSSVAQKGTDENLKIYTKDFKLVYDGKKSVNRKVKKLVHKSDLIMHTNSTAYYILSE